MDWLGAGPVPLGALARWEARGFSPGSEQGPGPRDVRLVFEREVGREAAGAPVADGPHRRVAAAILGYEVFPPSVVRGVVRRRPVEVGDTVGIAYQGVARGGLVLFFAARVVARFDTAGVAEGGDGGVWTTGFTYRTLAGHPELGEETFSVEKDAATGVVRVALRSWSRPGGWLTWVGAPGMRVVQRRANAAALMHLSARARGA